MAKPENKKWIWVVLAIFLLILTRFILFKKSPGYYKAYFSNEYSIKTLKEGWRQANVKPFATLTLLAKSKRLTTSYKIDNIAGNVLGFVPVAFLLSLLFSGRGLALRVIGITFLISLFFELIQLFSGLGSFDVDDLLLNSIGGALGAWIYYVFTPSENQTISYSSMSVQ